eukprot:gnl/TRDRNA2_/TRDRNA2_64370_c0_seq1.p1 gnl/TRDRNA2_/TRDRNA2_64370_c0~~gnl/TRDRNA2_/TRDRNA2_64370_c0_seq1.p1  ORF type:complete len:107 (+),score=0.11 gnl/TRDRNA2_/TRDRNA2_64370_c0_seq1:188-508(+)
MAGRARPRTSEFWSIQCYNCTHVRPGHTASVGLRSYSHDECKCTEVIRPNASQAAPGPNQHRIKAVHDFLHSSIVTFSKELIIPRRPTQSQCTIQWPRATGMTFGT